MTADGIRQTQFTMHVSSAPDALYLRQPGRKAL
jgi:hypothetical protein